MGHCAAPVDACGISGIVAVEADMKKDFGPSRIALITSWALVLVLLTYLILAVIENAQEVFP